MLGEAGRQLRKPPAQFLGLLQVGTRQCACGVHVTDKASIVGRGSLWLLSSVAWLL